MHGSIVIGINVSVTAGVVNCVNRNGQHIVCAIRNDRQLRGRSGRKRIAVVHRCLDLKQAGRIVDHAADLVDGTLVIGSVFIDRNRVTDMQLRSDLLRNREGNGLAALAGNNSQQNLGCYVVMDLDVADLHLTGDRCSHICKLHLVIVIQLCGIISDLCILCLGLRLLKCHTGDIACRKQCLLAGQVGIGIA